jgi:hypothetical protein
MNTAQIILVFLVAIVSSLYTSAIWVINTVNSEGSVLFGLSVVFVAISSIGMIVGAIGFLVTNEKKIMGKA